MPPRMGHTVEFTREKLERLKKLYYLAVKEGRDLLILDGDEYLVSYAKYLIEYLETKLPK